MITQRDAQVIRFLNDCKVAKTSTIARLYYSSYQVATRRLASMVEARELQRERDGWSSEYIYYAKKPKQIRHSLLVTDFYRELSEQALVKKFIVEPSLGGVRPDAVIGFVVNGVNRLALLEVEISNKGFDTIKYSRLNWQKYFSARPELVIVTDHKLPEIADYKTTIIGTDLKFKI